MKIEHSKTSKLYTVWLHVLHSPHRSHINAVRVYWKKVKHLREVAIQVSFYSETFTRGCNTGEFLYNNDETYVQQLIVRSRLLKTLS